MTPSDGGDISGARGSSRWRGLWMSSLAAAVLAGAVVAAHASAQPMLEPERVAVKVRGSGPSSDPSAMRRVIVEAASRHEWRVVQDLPGRLTLHVASRDHAATIDVIYDGDGFQIQYRDSTEMDYELEEGRRVIHPRYNKWITELGNEIRREARNGVRQRRHDAMDPDAVAPGDVEASGAHR